MLLYRALYLVHVLALAYAYGIQPRSTSKRAPAESTISILEKMTDTSVNSVCKFPSIAVLEHFKTSIFIEECNRPLPTRLTPHSAPQDVLCMGLYEIGTRLCNFITKYQLPPTVIPTEPSDFTKFINAPLAKELCVAFGSIPVVHDQEKTALEEWNVLQMFKKSPQACSQICFYLNGDENELCKLILWGNILYVDVSSRSSSQALQNPSEPISRNSDAVDKAVEEQANNYNHNVPQIEGEPSSPSQQNEQNPQKDSSNTKTSSLGSSHVDTQNPTSRKSMEVAGEQKPDSKIKSHETKQSSLESKPADQIDHRKPVDSQPHAQESSRDGAQGMEIIPKKSNEEVVKPLKKENSFKDLSSKHLDDGNQEANLGEQEKKVKVTSQEAASLPAVSSSIAAKEPIAPEPPTAPEKPVVAADTPVAPETPDEIVQDTASNPSIEANQDGVGAYDDPNLEQGEDEDMHFPSVAIDQPIKADESVNGDDDSLKPREDIKYIHERFEESEDSHFFRYFMTMVVICIFGYLLFHNKQKIFALFLEGRSRRGTRRRPNTANYHKLDSNLEEAVSSPCSTSVAHVIY